MDSISLKELTARVSLALEALDSEYWVVAEVAQANLNRRSGHCYLDLVEKDGEQLLAQMRATIWKWAYQKLASRFSLATGSELGAGMKVLLLVEVRYHEVYGLSLNVKDIDPSYTLGDMARKRRETIARLEKEGIIHKNRAAFLPLLPMRVAVVSSETAAGWGDFLNTLKAGGYGFMVTLYPAFMQGDRTEESVVAALGAIARRSGEYDAVALIRGGGSQVDLSNFDSYAIAQAVALMPLPVLVGIGHERDESVADMVAHTRLITPTAVAEFLVARFEEFEGRVDDLTARLGAGSRALMVDEGHRLMHLARELFSGSRAFVSENRGALDLAASKLTSASMATMVKAGGGLRMHGQRLDSGARGFVNRALGVLKGHGGNLGSHTRSYFRGQGHLLLRRAEGFRLLAANALRGEGRRLEVCSGELPHGAQRLLKAHTEALVLSESKVRLMDPVNVLRRGYSITTMDGRSVTDSGKIKKGDVLTTRFARGEATSVVRDSRVKDKEKESNG